MRTRRSIVPACAPFLLLAILSGCDATGPSADPSDEAAVTPSPSPSADAAELTATGEPLVAGRYTRAEFEPAITIELDGSWQAVQLANGFFDVQQQVGSPDVIAVQFARPIGIFGADGTSEQATNADKAVETLQANADLVIVESSGSRIGGLDGSQVTVENAGEVHASVMAVPPGALGIDPGRRLWIAFFDTPEGLLAIMVGGSVATWQEALSTAEPVLESVRIGQ